MFPLVLQKELKLTDVQEKDMQWVGVTEEDARDRMRWRKMICCSSWKKNPPGHHCKNLICRSIYTVLTCISKECPYSTDEKENNE